MSKKVPPHLIGKKWTGALFLLMTLILLAAGAGSGARAQQETPIRLTVQAGFDGACKEEAWLPVRVTVENQGPDLEGRLQASTPTFSGESVLYAQQISLPSVSRKETFLEIYPEGFVSEVTVTLISGGNEIARTTERVSCGVPADRLIGVLSETPTAFDTLGTLDPPNGRAILAQLEPGSLPDRAAALEALDILVISDVDTGQFSPAQQQALEAWVSSGGQLLVTGGAGWQRTAAGLAELLPVRPETTQTLQGLGALASFAAEAADTAQDAPSDLSGSTVIATGPLAPGVDVLVEQDSLPLIAVRELGFGQVVYLAADPALEPIASWSERAALYERLLVPAEEQPWTGGFLDWNAASGAISILPNLNVLPAGFFISFLCLYGLAIGPVNYLLVRLWKRRELAWITTPALVLAFSALAFLFGNQLRGDRPVLNQLAIVHVWPEAQQAQVDGLLGIFSPQRSTYQLELDPRFVAHPIPGFDGLTTQRDWLVLRDEAGNLTLPEMRIDVAELNAVALQGPIEAPEVEHSFRLRLTDSQAILEGSLTNETGLTLEDAVLLAAGKAERLGTIEPGQRSELQILLQDTDPAAAAGQGPGGQAGPFFSPMPAQNDFVFQILGTSDTYSDPKITQRYDLLRAFYGGTAPGMSQRSGGMYLAGWTDFDPFQASLGTRGVQRDNTVLLLVALEPELVLESDRILLPPALFNWTLLAGGTSSSVSPYNSFINPENTIFSYRPIAAVPEGTVESLTLHLKSYGDSGQVQAEVYLWDFEAEEWALQPNLTWGDHSIPSPARFTGPQGEVRLRLDNTSTYTPFSLETADFSMVIRP